MAYIRGVNKSRETGGEIPEMLRSSMFLENRSPWCNSTTETKAQVRGWYYAEQALDDDFSKANFLRNQGHILSIAQKAHMYLMTYSNEAFSTVPQLNRKISMDWTRQKKRRPQ